MQILVIGDDSRIEISFDSRNRIAFVDGRTVKLTRIEWSIIIALASVKGNALSKSDLVAAVWGDPSFATDDALKQRIWALRRKIGPEYIECIPGYGYRLSIPLSGELNS